MCLACKIIFKSCRNVGQVWIQNLDFIKASSRTLPKCTFVWLASWYPATGVVMFWNVSESVSCSGLMSLELKFQCILVYILIDCRWWSILTSWRPWTGSWKVLHLWWGNLFADLFFMWKMTKWVWHMLHSQLLTYVLQDLMHSWLAPYNCLRHDLVRHFDCNLAWNTCLDWDCCWCLSIQLFISFQPKAIGCQPVLCIQSTSTDWKQDVHMCHSYMKGEMSWVDTMSQLLSTTDVQFSDFKRHTAEYINRYICQFKSGYFEGCSGCIRFIFTLCSNLNLTSLLEKISLSTLQMEQTVV